MGLSIAVLPPVLIARMSMLAGLGSLGSFAYAAIAGFGAILGGGLGFVVAASLSDGFRRNRDDASVVSAINGRRIRPIDPQSELGSESLDAPIDTELFATEEDGEFEELATDGERDASAPNGLDRKEPKLGELSKRGYNIEEPTAASTDEDRPSFTRENFKDALIKSCEGATCEAAARDTSQDQPQEVSSLKAASKTSENRPREVSLDEFGELPGRNAVWVEEKQSSEQPLPSAATAPASALEKLRQKSPEDLSLVEMVERFAGALREHQEAERARTVQGAPRRDAALAEALKALTLFTERGFDNAPAGEVSNSQSEISQTEQELRAALSKLQGLRGAA